MDTYDLVITGGRVIDPETGLDAVRNVGIKGDQIATILQSPAQLLRRPQRYPLWRKGCFDNCDGFDGEELGF